MATVTFELPVTRIRGEMPLWESRAKNPGSAEHNVLKDARALAESRERVYTFRPHRHSPLTRAVVPGGRR